MPNGRKMIERTASMNLYDMMVAGTMCSKQCAPVLNVKPRHRHTAAPTVSTLVCTARRASRHYMSGCRFIVLR
jgi:hypothetical protein